MDRAAEVAKRFALIDVNKNGELDKEELGKVFGEHADQFLTYCDKAGAGNKDDQINLKEFQDAIVLDCADLDDATFQETWLDRMDKSIADAGISAAAAEGDYPP